MPNHRKIAGAARPARSKDPPERRPRPSVFLCEAHAPSGLEAIAVQELKRRFPKTVRLQPTPASDQRSTAIRFPYAVIRFEFTGSLLALLQLRTVLVVYLVRHYPVPRPRALLGDEHFRALLAQITVVRELLPASAYQNFYLSAAGSDSAVMRRLAEQITRHTGLPEASHEGDLQISLRRAWGGGEGWDGFVRLSPRPLTTRAWRVCNFHGALNAAVAHAMVLLTQPKPGDVFLNVACGSGTLLIERLAAGAAQRVLGCDIDAQVLGCAHANAEAGGFGSKIELCPWDAAALPLPDHSVDAICADLPFGHLVGSHRANLALYPAILAETARVARPHALFVLISHEVRLMDELLAGSSDWSAEQAIQVSLGGLHPRVFVLRRQV